MLGEHSLRTWSATQGVVALSSAEAELYAMMKGASETLGMLSLAMDFGDVLDGRVRSDASAAIGIVNRTGVGKLRHIRVQYLWLQDKVRRGELTVRKVPGEANPADMMTKHLAAEAMQAHLGRLQCEVLTDRAATAPTLHMVGYMGGRHKKAAGDRGGDSNLEDEKLEDPRSIGEPSLRGTTEIAKSSRGIPLEGTSTGEPSLRGAAEIAKSSRGILLEGTHIRGDAAGGSLSDGATGQNSQCLQRLRATLGVHADSDLDKPTAEGSQSAGMAGERPQSLWVTSKERIQKTDRDLDTQRSEDQEDAWEKSCDCVVRLHERTRRELFTPSRVQGGPPCRTVTPTRITEGKFVNGKTFRIVDSWTARASAHALLPLPWTGRTTFVLKTPAPEL